MPRMDWSEVPVSDYKPGIYLAEVKKCETKTSRAGEPYLNVELHDVEAHPGTGSLICFDRLMFSGRARGISQAKLKVLGFRGTEPSIEPEDLVGRRAWIRVDWNEYRGQDGELKRNLQVTVQFRPVFESGYWNEKTPPPMPEGGVREVPRPADEDIPF